MSKIDYQALREKAEKETWGGVVARIWRGEI